MGWLARKRGDPDRSARRAIPLHRAPVEVQIMGRGSLDVLHARNVSETGLGIYVPHGFAGFDLDAEVELVVTLPGERSFLARGAIVHVTEGSGEANHFGLQFTSIARGSRSRVAAYVASRLD